MKGVPTYSPGNVGVQRCREIVYRSAPFLELGTRVSLFIPVRPDRSYVYYTTCVP